MLVIIQRMQPRQLFRILLPLAVFFCMLAVAAVLFFGLIWFPTTSQAGSQAATIALIKYAAIGVVLLAFPFWMGVGLDGLFARIKNPNSRRVVPWVVLSGLVLVFICLPLGIVGYVNLQIAGGGDTGWRKLAPVPDAPATIASAGIAEVIMQGASGKYYSCKTAIENQCWLPTEATSDRFIESYPGQMEPAPALGTKPPGEVVSQVGVLISQGVEKSSTYYAILKDGSLWYLTRSPAAPGTSDFATGFLLLLSVPFCGAVFLLLLGVVLGRVSRWLSSAVL
ncbi:MAG: hypothetical protein WCK35_19375 [Chloroflexota bacterium]